MRRNSKKKRFTDEQILKIREEYGVMDTGYLSKKYKVSRKTILDIGKYRIYIV